MTRTAVLVTCVWGIVSAADARAEPNAADTLKEFPPMATKQLPRTKPLTMQGDLAEKMVAGLQQFLRRRIQAGAAERKRFWKRDFSSRDAYVRSVSANRARLARSIGVVDPRVPFDALEHVGAGAPTSQIAKTAAYTVHTVRWPVLAGVDAEGLLLEPTGAVSAQVVALGDADFSPEMLVGLADGLPAKAQFARRLAAHGCRVLVPVLIDRKDTWSGNPKIRMTNQPHREWIYRQAFEMGRHVIGYEVQKVLAAVGWLAAQDGGKKKIGVIGYGEGGLLALYAAGVDTRIDATVVSGYFRRREEIWSEPIYRNVWALLQEFGDAGVAGLIAPRMLVIEASLGPNVPPPRVRRGRSGADPGRIVPAPLESTKAEFGPVRQIYARLRAPEAAVLVGDGSGAPGSEEALSALLRGLGVPGPLKPAGRAPADGRKAYDPIPRLKRQFNQLVAYTQGLMRASEHHRARTFWTKLDYASPGAYEKSCRPLREAMRKEVIGELPLPDVPPNPRTRLAYGRKGWAGYQVVLDVWQGAFAYGLLLLPTDLKPGERRPVVVCQHGLEGRPLKTIDPKARAYNRFAAKLAERGFVVFSPQNPYIGGDRFRVLQRMAQPMKCTLFSIIVRQHERILEWLADQPFVDPKRIGFYGISYGGKTAMRVPPLVGGYCLSICSADFNEWVVKNVTVDWRYSYMFTGEYEMSEFNLGHTLNYAEMAALIAPRPFMVERGHRDGVAPDEWVAYEYAKVRRLYTRLGIGERTEIEFFNGPHEIHGVGTFRFLHKHLNWPEPPGAPRRAPGASPPPGRRAKP